MSAPSLAGRTVLVTGASRGIGRATAEALAAAGAWVAMVARSEADLRRAAEAFGGHALVADVTSSTSVARLAEQVGERIGGAPDILVNAAGVFGLAPFIDTASESLEQHLTTNVVGPFNVVRAFLPEMLARRSGHVVNVGSVAGRIPLPGNAAYGASKYGLRGLHEILAVELQGTGVKATLVEPAATDTSLWDPLDPDHRSDLPSRSQMLRPEDVARAIAFAVSQPTEVEISALAIRSIG